MKAILLFILNVVTTSLYPFNMCGFFPAFCKDGFNLSTNHLFFFLLILVCLMIAYLKLSLLSAGHPLLPSIAYSYEQRTCFTEREGE